MSRRQLVSVFTQEEDVLGAVGDLVEAGFAIGDVYTPYAVHGLDRVAGLPRSRMGVVCGAAAAIGSTAFFFFQDWVSATDWPLNVGGKPFSSLPAWLPVVFEAGVLTAGLSTVLALFIVSRLWPGKRPELVHPRATDDRFVVVQEIENTGFDLAKAQGICETHHAESVEVRQLADPPRIRPTSPIEQLEVWR